MSGPQTEKTAEPQLSAERLSAADCQRRSCPHETWEEALVPVEVGGITQYWCPDCAQSETGLSLDDLEQGIRVRPLLNARTVGAFTAGVLLTAIVFSILAV